MTSERMTLLAENTLGTQQGHAFGIVFVAAPQPLSSDKSSVTLWDEIAPPAPLPTPVPAPQPGDTQHAMEGGASNQLHQ